MPPKKKQKPQQEGGRRSKRITTVEKPRKAAATPIVNGVLYMDKQRDGQESARRAASLQAHLKQKGLMVYEKLPAGPVLTAANDRRRRSREGKAPCYDIMDPLGSSIYAYSLPLTLMAGLLQGLKSRDAVSSFKSEKATLASHKGTNYMFLHWQGRGMEESENQDYREHKFIKSRPGLETTIESLGNFISRRILLNPAIGAGKFPGMLANQSIGTTADQEFQDPHWDFEGWRQIKAEEMPWIVHIPICKEGMMLHVWPTERDHATHSLKDEKLRLGTPKLVYVAFGDYLLLRADVCHGGCFGSLGNMRFHMVLRCEGCNLENKNLHMLKWVGIDPHEFAQKKKYLSQLLGKRGTYFENQRKMREKTVTAYKRALETTVYPEFDEWAEGLLDNLEYKDTEKKEKVTKPKSG
jgi:hypothetical protein